MTDNDLLLLVKGKYVALRNLSRAEAVLRVAEEYGMTRSGVSGRVSRAEQTVSGLVALMTYLSKQPLQSASASKISALVDTARLDLSRHRSSLVSDLDYYAIYLPDMHVPRQHNQALELAYVLIADLENVAYVSTLNDGFDFARLSRWTDRRSLPDVEGDIANSLNIYKQHMATLKLVAPAAFLPAIVGNHDLRVFNDDGTGTGGYTAANLMTSLAESGVAFVDNLRRENVFSVNDGLVWAHGYRAMQDRRSGARKNYADIQRQVSDDMQKRVFDLVFGHTHSAHDYQLTAVGPQVVNAGCLCDLQPTYMRKRPDWQLGLVVSKFHPGSDEHDTRLIKIEEKHGHLTALNPFNGKSYSVKGTAYA